MKFLIREADMLEIDIPGFGPVKLEHIVSDFTGTLSVNGNILPGVKERLARIADILHIHIITADAFGTALNELEGIRSEIHILNGPRQDIQKGEYTVGLAGERVVAIGNGNNDRQMLKIARIGIAVIEGEGCSVEALTAANIHVRSIIEGLDLLLNPMMLKATLQY
jgi:soluble P-type ATPase